MAANNIPEMCSNGVWPHHEAGEGWVGGGRGVGEEAGWICLDKDRLLIPLLFLSSFYIFTQLLNNLIYATT